ncbi:GNAT family N-acetyltransferase [Aeromonas aquatica]|uniref:GNAT family N-acetyltransferase n=1 Tax=Aeromonas aquatica TaxID=558964 RepID=UPI00051C350F|nr:GNAT family N-acetyltransferase [Aeromonas aquatica]
MKMKADSCTIRLAGGEDGAALAGLFGQLGYQTRADEVVARLLAPDPATEVLLASLGSEVLGVLVWHRLQPLHVACAWGLISALVIDEAARGSGIGTSLLATAEVRALAQGCSQLELSSSLKREGAHRFYLGQGYLEHPKRFVKVL